MSGSHLTKEFFDLVKSIGESKSKQEEDRIIINEVALLKRKLSNKYNQNEDGEHSLDTSKSDPKNINTDKKRAKEYLVRLMYVEMLGHDGSFGYIKVSWTIRLACNDVAMLQSLSPIRLTFCL